MNWAAPRQVLAAKVTREKWASAPDQLTLAELIDSSAYDRHIRRMRHLYRHRGDQLVATLAERAPHVIPAGIAAGLQAVLRLPPGPTTVGPTGTFVPIAAHGERPSVS